jgi:hypothetical protein
MVHIQVVWIKHWYMTFIFNIEHSTGTGNNYRRKWPKSGIKLYTTSILWSFNFLCIALPNFFCLISFFFCQLCCDILSVLRISPVVSLNFSHIITIICLTGIIIYLIPIHGTVTIIARNDHNILVVYSFIPDFNTQKIKDLSNTSFH